MKLSASIGIMRRVSAVWLASVIMVAADDDPHSISDPLAAEAAMLTSGFDAPAPAPPTSNASTQGQWGSVISWTPHIPVTAATLPDGRLLTFASNLRTTFPEGPEFTYAAVWDPATGVFVEINNSRHDMFCGGTAMLPDGRVVINGGRNTTDLSSIFDYRTNQWNPLQNMNDPRWYNTSLVLPDGTVFTVSGSGGSNTAELWNSATGWRRLTGVGWSAVTSQPGYTNFWHPFVMLAPNGNLFHFGPTDAMNWVTTSGSGSLAAAGLSVPGPHYPKEGAWAMHDVGRILVAGGGANTTENGYIEGGSGTSTNVAYTVNLNGSTPVITQTGSMAYNRQFPNSVVLPNGEVLVIGGNTTGQKFNDTGSILTPEIWNPGTGAWRTVANMTIPRNYHSVALLLPDGRVWSGGGGLGGNAADHQDAQIYTPPSLFTSNGSLATRPVITDGPVEIGLGSQFTVSATPGLTKFAFIRMSAQTHSMNTDLRYLSLPFTETSPGVYALTGHASQNVMLPGYWMLFGLKSNGVHSVAKIIQVSLNPGVTVANPGNQLSVGGEQIELVPSVSAPPGTVIQYSATGLPGGLSIDTNTGVISGTLTATSGDYFTTIVATPAGGIPLSLSFNWTVLLPNLGSGKILREWWTGINGNVLNNLTNNAAYPANPGGREFLFTFETPTDWAEASAQRIRGYLHPAVTGFHKLWIASDDQSRLLLSSDANPANAVEIASAPSWTNAREWTKFSQQASAPIMLEAGKRYYIEALVKEGDGGDHLAVGWQPPNEPGTLVIPGQYLSPYDPVLAPVAAWHLDEVTWNGTAGEVKESMETVSGIHGTAVGGALTASDGPVLAGNPGTGRTGLFSGAGQQVAVPFNAALNPGDFTLSAWVRPLTSTSPTLRAVAVSRKTVSGAQHGFGLYASDDGKWKFFTGPSWTGLIGPSVAANVWSHIAASFRTTGISGGVRTGIRRIYLNGVQVAEDTGTYTPVTAADFLIGASNLSGGVGYFMEGRIDEVRLHAMPLSAEDVAGTMTLRHRLNYSPTMVSPGALANLRNSIVSQPILGNDQDGDPLTFSASGLPDGLSISPGSGVVSGSPLVLGAFNVTITATDPAGESGSTSFIWSILENLSVTPVSAPPSAAGTTVTFNAISNGGINPRYRWNFGDGSPDTAFTGSTSTTHNFPGPGRYLVTVTATDDSGGIVSGSFHQAIHAPLTANRPTASSAICYESRTTGNDRVWVVNPDNNSVTVIDAVTRVRLMEIPVGTSPRCVAVAPDGRIWLTNAASATLSIISPETLSLVETITLPRGSRPYGLAFSPTGTAAFVTLENTGMLLKLHPLSGAQITAINLGKNIRHLSITGDGSSVHVSRFITPRLPGEETGVISTSGAGGEVIVVDAGTNSIVRTLLLHHSQQTDSSTAARGIPNYLGAPAISPDGLSAWVPSKQDNIKRGILRDNQSLTHDMSVRSIASRLDLTLQSEDIPARVDFDNAGVPSALAFDPWGIHAFVALEASRMVAVVDVWNHHEILRFDAGRAPQGLAVAPNGRTLFVYNFMDRSVTVHDVGALIDGIASPPPAAIVVPTVVVETLAPQVLLGKQHFYDAKDNRLALQEYLSCAACHNDSGDDGRIWDFTGFGEGLRNTISLRGHGGNSSRPLHWSGNFDEVQDFENQIRSFSGGTGLIPLGSAHPPLGIPNAGRSADLDALAAYLESLDTHGESPHRQADGGLSPAAAAGKQVFRTMACASCHGGPDFTHAAAGNFPDIGTIKHSSGQRLGAPLTGINIPTLRGLWSSAPYLHDGSAATLEQAITAHQGTSIGATDLTKLVAYLESIDDQPAIAPTNSSPIAVADTTSTNEDTPLVLGVVQLVTPNDTDADGDTLVISAVSNPINGTIALNPDGSTTFTPTANFNGAASFDYTISDGIGGTDTASVAITVNPAADAPVAVNDIATTNEDTALTLGVAELVTPNDTDADGDTLVISAVSNPVNGIVVLNPDGSTTFTPTSNFHGAASFDYTISDGNGGTDSATVAVTVNPVADAPVAANDIATTNEDTAIILGVAELVTPNDTDSDTDPLVISAVANPVNGTIALNPDGTTTFTPTSNFHGAASFDYTISDGNGGTDSATVAVTVNSVADAPVAANDIATTNEDTSLILGVAELITPNDTDADGDTLVISAASNPINGTIVLNPDGSTTFTPTTNFNGASSFDYTISDGNGGSNTATVAITVNPTADAPVAVNDVAITNEDSPLTLGIAELVTPNDTDADGDTLVISAVSNSVNGTIALNPDGSVTFTPTTNFHGAASFDYTISDGNSGTDTATVAITVNPAADAPVAVNDVAITNEDSPLILGIAEIVTPNDTDSDGDTLVISAVSNSVNGTIALNPDGSVTFTPTANFHGAASFDYTISDGNGGTDTATVAITVNPATDAPVAVNDVAITNEDSPLILGIAEIVTPNDTDSDTDPLVISAVANPVNGTIALNPDGTTTFTPTANFNGAGSFDYTISDGTGGTDSATVAITVSPIADAPVAATDIATTNEDTALTLGIAELVTPNDTDADGDTLVISAVSNPINGTLALNPNGSTTFTPTANFHGAASFDYTISDGTGGNDTASVAITVNPAIDAPVAANDMATTNEDASLTLRVAELITPNDTDADGDTLAISAVSNPINGTVALNPDGSTTFTPTANFHGAASFDYTISDGTATATASVAITVNPAIDAPVAANDMATTNEDASLTLGVAELITPNDTDADGDTLVISAVSNPLNGTVALNPDGSTTFTPTANFNGTSSFDYTISDGTATANASVSITVNPVADAPVAANDITTTNEDAALTLGVAELVTPNDTDADGDTLVISAVSNPLNGTVALNPDGSTTFTPTANFNGAASFDYTISDGTGGSDTATVAITVNSAADAPVAVNDLATTNEDTALTLGTAEIITPNDTDADGDTLVISAVSNPLNGTVALNPDGSTTFTPASNFHGAASFDYTISDGNGGTDTATVAITVSPVADAPVAVNDIATTNEDAALTLGVAELVTPNDTDADTDPLVISAVANPINGTIVLNPDGSTTFTPTSNFHGAASFDYTISDGNGGTDSATVAVTVNPVADAPVAANDIATTNEDTAIILGVAELVTPNDTDADADTLVISAASNPANGTVLLNPDGSTTFTPTSNSHGAASFDYTISDGNGGTDSATVAVTVNPVADAPVAANDIATTNEDTSLILGVAELITPNDTDADGDTLVISAVSNPINGTVALNPDGSTTFTPTSNFHGAASFDYTISDGNGGTDSATVAITVNPVADAPVAVNDIAATNEDAALTLGVAQLVTPNDTDADGDTLVISAVSNPINGTIVINPDGSTTFTPTTNFNGASSFDYTISDGTATATATVAITVNPAANLSNWLATFGLNAAPNEDPDGDSISNAIEYVIGGNPLNEPDTALLPTVEMTFIAVEGTPTECLCFTYRRTDLAHADPTTKIAAEWSPDLSGTWITADESHDEIIQIHDQPGENFDKVKIFIPCSQSSTGVLMMRLRVTMEQTSE